MKSYLPYSKYKPSEIDWIGDIPEDWKTKKLKYELRLKNAKASASENPVALENIESWTGHYIHSDSEFEGEGVAFRTNDILFGKLRPYLAKVLLAESAGEAIGDFFVLEPQKNINAKYASYLMRSRGFIELVDGSTYGSKMPRVDWSLFSSILLSLPPLAEQQSIAEFLDRETGKIDDLIGKRERLIALLQEKRAAVISHAVTKGLDPNVKLKPSGIDWLGDIPEHWEIIPIKFLSRVQRGASPRPIDDPIFFDDNGQYAWIRISDVSASGMLLYVTEQKLSNLGASLSVKLKEGDLFLSIAGSVGKPCILGIRGCIHDGFVHFPYLKENPKFIFRIFESGDCYAGLGKLGTQLNLNTDTIGSIRIGHPSRNEQNIITEFLDHETTKIDSLIDKENQIIDKLREYRTALISAAVTGKINVRGEQ